MELTFYTLDVFTDRLFGGNQLAVFPNAPELDAEVMQAIAREFNYSETVFVRPSEAAGALRRLRIFTPGGELPFAGHPTIGTAQLLAELGIAPRNVGGSFEFALEENVGLVPVNVSKTNGTFFTWLTAARLPERGPGPPPAGVLAPMLGLSSEEILSNNVDAPSSYSAGVPFTFVPVRDLEALAKATLDLSRWRDLVAQLWSPDIYLFCPETNTPGVDVRARMFGPAMGITEDPATGGAAAAFAGYLWARNGRAGEWIIAQGVEMGRPSELHVQAVAHNGRLAAVRVGGSAVRVSQGTMRIP